MSARTLFCLTIGITALLIASGCAPECTHQELDSYSINNLKPHDEVISSSQSPSFEWSWTTQCNPHQFIIEASKNQPGPGTTYPINGIERTYTPSTPWDAGGKYYWSMYPISSDQYIGRDTYDRILYIGPMCSGTPSQPPVLDYPADGEFITPRKDYSDIEFHWHYDGGCLPTTYLYEFATDPNFQNIIESGETADHQQFVALHLPDCTTFYWHVAAKNGSQVGPFSPTQSFSWIWNPHCWMNHYLSDEIALIRGTVYLDECSQTGKVLPNNSTLAEGCIQQSHYGVIGDGVRDWNEDYMYGDEPGLSDVQVDLGAGPCPSIGLDQTTTGANGKFRFTVMTPGTYCLSVHKNQTGQQGGTIYDMNYGLWTEPRTKSFRAEYTIDLGDGYYDLLHSIAWDEYEGFVKPFFKVPTWCRWRPYPICDPLHMFEIGDMAPMIARNEAGTWFETRVNGQTCYFYNSNYEVAEITADDVGMPVEKYLKMFDNLRVFDDPDPCPIPTPTPRPKPPSSGNQCSKYKSESSCMADPKCEWKFASVGPGYCTKK